MIFLMNPSIKIEYSARFKKQFAKLSPKVRTQFKLRQRLWVVNPSHPRLRVHELSGAYAGLYSINVTGDIRAIYKKVNNTYFIFGFIGTHAQLYS